ncbi:MAG: peptide chain release factor 2 [Candidatus Magasanikbacteria bacterium CG11_big_fil_rev_8_21_14_0_20_39_34]|uniref:Peptide chain release factor 2 n=1 Tax=Candidatus Magasanikbacteria bacterium CG11_big_fil_rev_8_21_14_0_20_39_34 TaxID=1974653 RepID=A0A2H0N472_9BACT|nr:MAG: peptide chain release factor 2 [Candidatus Magasanikbacteria bacterium CG11_big_fil_rev_8_21_14_0_20_39_34]
MDIHALEKSFVELREKLSVLKDILHIEEKKGTITEKEQKVLDPHFWDNPELAAKISKELADLQTEVQEFTKLQKDITDIQEITSFEEDNTTSGLGEELDEHYKALVQRLEKMEFFALMDGKYDTHNAIVSFHAGSGGTEAQDWAQMLLRMVMRFSEMKGWKVVLLDESKGSEAGIKSATIRVEGRYAYGYLQSEHGTHRLVRISPFDAESMRHTSFAGIEVIPEIESEEAVEIDDKDLRIDTFMSSGKGGQSVNTTYSAVRIVHLPTGITVQCQNERSQLQNKETALKILRSKLLQKQEEEEAQKREELRGEYKSADWGNQIRSYVLHPYKQVKDVRTKYESQDPDAVLDGNLEEFMESYLRYRKS